jgi:gluconokinase
MRAITIMGVSGCGKSSLGEALAAKLGWPFLEGDSFHDAASVAKMAAGIALTDADRQGWLERLALQLQAHPEGVVLSCSALKRSYREGLRAARPDLGFVFLAISPALALQRVAARAHQHLFPASLVQSQFQTLESPSGEDGVLTLEAAWPLQQQLDLAAGWARSHA